MEKPQLMFYIKLSVDSCLRIVITGKRRTITNVNLWHDDGCVVLTETKGGKIRSIEDLQAVWFFGTHRPVWPTVRLFLCV